jgi:hypothetical protein
MKEVQRKMALAYVLGAVKADEMYHVKKEVKVR